MFPTQHSLYHAAFLCFFNVPLSLVQAFHSPQTLTHLTNARPQQSSLLLHASPALMVGSSTRLALAGKIVSTMQRLFIGSSEAKKIGSALLREGYAGDLLVLAALGYGAIPLARCMRKLRQPEQTEASWLSSMTYKGAHALSQLCSIGCIVYAVDMLAVALKVIGFNFPFRMNLSNITAQIGFLMWSARFLATMKTFLLCRSVQVKSPDMLGRHSLYDRMGNGLIGVAVITFILDILRVETGNTVGSMFALGGVGTLVLSLASKDIASDFVSGLALSASNRFHEGEEVRIGNEFVGIVTRIGWMHTDVRGYDEIISRIPNSKIAHQNIQNISRITRSQVKQCIYFDYDDIDKIPKTISDIKLEIARSCPQLVTDGSRPFWCHWREFKETKLEVIVDTHFTIRHGSTEYFDVRQQVLLAIASAAKKNNVKFALPILSLRNAERQPTAFEAPHFTSQSHNIGPSSDQPINAGLESYYN